MAADATSESLSAHKATTPGFKVTLNGTEFTQDAPLGLSRISVETHLDKIGVARLTFAPDANVPSSLAIGQDVEISFAPSDTKVFKGYITGITHAWKQGTERFTVVAMDPLVKLAASNATKVWGGKPDDKIKDSAVAGDVLSAGGVDQGTVDQTAGERPYVFQRAESNLAFLKRLAGRNGYLVYAEEGKVHFKKPQFSNPSEAVAQNDIIDMEYTVSDRQIPTKVKVFGWDYMTKKQVKGELEASGTDGIGGGGAPEPVTWKAEHHIVDVFVNSDSAAAEMAKAEMNRLARTLVQGRCTTPLNGKVIPGSKVKFEGSFKKFNPEALVVGVRHMHDTAETSRTQFWFVGNTNPE